MASITTRETGTTGTGGVTRKNLPLTNAEIDTNFISLNDNKLETTWTGNTSIVTLGTVTTGTWSATTIATTRGGTGLTSFTNGGAVYATSTSALTTGTLPVASGGTGATDAAGARSNLGISIGVGGSQPYDSDLASIAGLTGTGLLSRVGDGSWVIGGTLSTTDMQLNSLGVGTAASTVAGEIRASNQITSYYSDERLKENILPLTDSLNKIKQLNGVSYQWKDRSAGGDDIRIGFIAQQVESVEPLLVFTNKVDSYKGIHIDSIIPMLVEAVKELSSGSITNTNTYIETQSIIAEDNNIDLNYDGNTQTAIGGGIRVLHALGQDISAELLIDSEGNWVTNNDLKPNALTVPVYTPKSSLDSFGNEGNITRDDNFMYVKTSMGWRRSNLESF